MLPATNHFSPAVESMIGNYERAVDDEVILSWNYQSWTSDSA